MAKDLLSKRFFLLIAFSCIFGKVLCISTAPDPDSIVSITPNSAIQANFVYTILTCSDSVEIQFTDLSSDPSGTINSWNWQTNWGHNVNIQNPILTFYLTGTYFVELTVGSTSGDTTTYVDTIVITLPDFKQIDTVALCLGDTNILLNKYGNPDNIYTWSPSAGLSDSTIASPLAFPDTTTTYTVEILSFFNNDTCRAVKNLTVIVQEPLSLGPDTVSCEPSIHLHPGLGNLDSIFWYQDSINGPVLNVNGEPSIQVTPLTPTRYWVSTVDSFGCPSEDDILVSPGNIRIWGDTLDFICLIDTVNLEIKSTTDVNDLNKLWSSSDMSIIDSTSNRLTFFPDKTTSITVYAENQLGCVDTAYYLIRLSPVTPPLDITASDTLVSINTDVQLLATQDNGYIYSWQPSPTLSSLNIHDPIATPLTDQYYYLSIEDENGCINQDSIFISVRSICDASDLYIPNAFTPDGNGTNDVLYVRTTEITEFYLAIFDRWGEKVFETKNIEHGWDGTYAGKALPPDVFGYYFEGKCEGGRDIFKKGNISLLR